MFYAFSIMQLIVFLCVVNYVWRMFCVVCMLLLSVHCVSRVCVAPPLMFGCLWFAFVCFPSGRFCCILRFVCLVYGLMPFISMFDIWVILLVVAFFLCIVTCLCVGVVFFALNTCFTCSWFLTFCLIELLLFCYVWDLVLFQSLPFFVFVCSICPSFYHVVFYCVFDVYMRLCVCSFCLLLLDCVFLILVWFASDVLFVISKSLY